ncbi:acyl-CoA dehydrogenase family protein [Psychroflexus aestuariivivens]|uniref:hypothetical protein n=1 Tax=Psychroflexus aestuariivivens TaxID=1795040 RepID=UPI000FDB38A4|nr:hypothetical protein [Psychroflexus aestuariivivens]
MRKITLEDYKKSEISEDLLRELFERNWFKMFVPKDFGGLELDLKTASQHITETAAHFGGLGWVLNLGAGANWFSGFFETEAAKTIFSPSKTVIAGSGSESGSFKEKKNTVILNGSWSKCSGAAHANYFSLNAKNEDSGAISSFVVPRSSVKFSDEKWEIFGLKSTSSLTIHLKDVKIPKSFGFQINSIENHSNYKVFHIPFEQFARVCMSSCFIGIAQCFLNTLESEQVFGENFEVVTETLQQKISMAIRSRDQFAEIIQNESEKGVLKKNIQDDLQSELGEANISIFDEIQHLFKKGGLALVEETEICHWAYRDVLTAIQHYMMKP